jgi:hypothetical protein
MLNPAPSSEGAGLNTTPQEGLTMRTQKYFVAIGADGLPVAQRVSVRETTYVSASRSGSFSSLPQSARHPLSVVQPPKPVEWVGRVELPDGTKVTTRSKAGRPGRNFLRYSYMPNSYGTKALRERATRDHWTDDSEEDVRASYRSDSSCAYKIEAFVPAQIELRNWPTPGDSIVLK